MDAFIVRGMLVPAIMKVAGDVNWWAPTFMRRVAPRPRPVDRFPLRSEHHYELLDDVSS